MNLPLLFADAAEASSGINWHSFFFLLFALVSCGMALAVLFSSNIVRMAFYLTVSLGAVSGLFILAGAHFVGAMQLMIYVGGTLVLLIFGVMLTAQAQFVEMKTRGGEWILAAIVGGSLLAVLVAAATSVEAWSGPTPEHLAAIENIHVEQETTSLGAALVGLRLDKLSERDNQLRRGFSGYFLHFEIVSVHLLVVLLGAAYLARARHTVGEALPAARSSTPPANRRRGWAMSIFLFLATLAYVASAVACFYIYAVGFARLFPEQPAPERWVWIASGVGHLASTFAMIAILRWQAWGFFALCIIGLIQPALFYAAGLQPTWLVLALLGANVIWLAILFGLLNVGGNRSVWAQME